MDASELATTMLEWEKARRHLDELTAIIQAATLEIGKTQTVGNVRATYSAGRKTYDYLGAASNVPCELWEPYAKKSYDWKAICEAANITDIPFKESEPSVTVKLLES